MRVILLACSSRDRSAAPFPVLQNLSSRPECRAVCGAPKSVIPTGVPRTLRHAVEGSLHDCSPSPKPSFHAGPAAGYGFALHASLCGESRSLLSATSVPSEVKPLPFSFLVFLFALPFPSKTVGCELSTVNSLLFLDTHAHSLRYSPHVLRDPPRPLPIPAQCRRTPQPHRQNRSLQSRLRRCPPAFRPTRTHPHRCRAIPLSRLHRLDRLRLVVNGTNSGKGTPRTQHANRGSHLRRYRRPTSRLRSRRPSGPLRPAIPPQPSSHPVVTHPHAVCGVPRFVIPTGVPRLSRHVVEGSWQPPTPAHTPSPKLLNSYTFILFHP